MMVWSQLHHMWQGPISPATRHSSSVPAHTYTNIHTSHYTCTCIRADIRAHVYVRIYTMGSAHVYVQILRHMYTCGYIFLMLLRLAVHICIRAKILRAYVYVRRYILWLIIYYLILLNLTLANPHTELAMARLSSPANTTTISNNSTPGVVKTKIIKMWFII